MGIRQSNGSLESDVSEVGIGNVPDKYPANFEHTLPLIRGPDGATSSIIYWGQHLRHTAEMTTVSPISKIFDTYLGSGNSYLALTLKNK